MKERIDGLRKVRTQRSAYERMLAMVDAWVPPSSDHVGLKDFMRSQLKQSIDFDCGESHYQSEQPAQSFDEWRITESVELRQRVKSAEDSLREEIERANGRTQWVRSLRESLQLNARPTP